MTDWILWATVRITYAIRPYDMLADRRRWFWQPRQHCGAPPDVIAAITEHLEHEEKRETE